MFKTSAKCACANAPMRCAIPSVNGACEFLVDWSRAIHMMHYPSARELVPAAREAKARPGRAKMAFVVMAALAGVLSARAAE